MNLLNELYGLFLYEIFNFELYVNGVSPME